MGYAISLKGAGTGSMVGVTAFQLTQAEYNANKRYYDSLNAFIVITDTGIFDAIDVNFFNGNTQLQSTNVQDAIVELSTKMNTEVQDIDIRLNPDTGKPEWRERGADTWSPFKNANPQSVSFTVEVNHKWASGNQKGTWGAVVTATIDDDGNIKFTNCQQIHSGDGYRGSDWIWSGNYCYQRIVT